MLEFMEQIIQAGRIAIGGHVRPDGDCIGSCLALQQYLKKKYPQKSVDVYLEQPPSVFAYLKGFDEIRTEVPIEEEYDLFLALDSSSIDRLDFSEPLFCRTPKKLCIDHHISNTSYADKTFVIPEASSTAEVLYEMLLSQAQQEGMTESEFVDFMGQEIAAAFYTGIVHDTGIFKYSSTSPRTLGIAAHLIQTGIPFPQIIDESFYQKTYIQTQIMGRCLLESVRVMNGKVVFSALSQNIMKFYDAGSEDLDGIIDQLRVIKGVEVAILLHETKTQEYKVSMRSNGAVDVQRVAVYFGGGGHVKAAGCTIHGSVYDVVNNLTRLLEEQMAEEKKEVI